MLPCEWSPSNADRPLHGERWLTLGKAIVVLRPLLGVVEQRQLMATFDDTFALEELDYPYSCSTSAKSEVSRRGSG
jgi:hypothetical protein